MRRSSGSRDASSERYSLLCDIASYIRGFAVNFGMIKFSTLRNIGTVLLVPYGRRLVIQLSVLCKTIGSAKGIAMFLARWLLVPKLTRILYYVQDRMSFSADWLVCSLMCAVARSC